MEKSPTKERRRELHEERKVARGEKKDNPFKDNPINLSRFSFIILKSK